MLFDVNLLFWHNSSTFAFTAGEYVTLVGATGDTASSVINLGHPEDMGIGDGEFLPKVRVYAGTANITSACTTLTLNTQFQGSTNNILWTTYLETCASLTSSYLANTCIAEFDVPRRPAGVGLPQYYRLNLHHTNDALSTGISSGSIIGGIVIQAPDADDTIGQYPANFTVA